jgi:hypothetical protein
LKTEFNVDKAEYRAFKIAQFQGNPLIEALRPALDMKSFAKKIAYRVLYAEDEKLDDFERELSIELIDLTYTVPPELYSLYKTILKNILTGYIHRNPVTRDMKAEQHKVSVEDDYHFPVTVNLSKCISIIGVSGAGKTLSVRQCCSFFPQVIRHSSYKGESLILDQIVYIEFQAPVTKTRRGFVLSFFIAVDQVIGTSYYNEWKGKSISIPILIQEAKKVALNHALGLAFIDEIQRCASTGAKDDYPTLEFIDDFFNSVGVPLVVAGTPKARPLFDTTMSTTRRLSSSRKFTISNIDNDLSNLEEGDQSYWFIFLNNFYYPQLLKRTFEFDFAFMTHVHELTAGLPALTARLMRLAYEQAVESEVEILSIELLDEVYYEQFDLLHKAIASLISGDDYGYEDILPNNAFKTSNERLIEEAIRNDIIYHERLAKKNKADEGDVIEFDDVAEDYIPFDDIRNLKGLSEDKLIEKLVK